METGPTGPGWTRPRIGHTVRGLFHGPEGKKYATNTKSADIRCVTPLSVWIRVFFG